MWNNLGKINGKRDSFNRFYGMSGNKIVCFWNLHLQCKGYFIGQELTGYGIHRPSPIHGALV